MRNLRLNLIYLSFFVQYSYHRSAVLKSHINTDHTKRHIAKFLYEQLKFRGVNSTDTSLKN